MTQKSRRLTTGSYLAIIHLLWLAKTIEVDQKMPADNREDILKMLRDQLPHLSSQYGVKRIGLFGSFSRGQEHRLSDVDIVVEFASPIGLRFVDFADYLEGLLGRAVDILTPDGIRGIRNPDISETIRGSIVYV